MDKDKTIDRLKNAIRANCYEEYSSSPEEAERYIDDVINGNHDELHKESIERSREDE